MWTPHRPIEDNWDKIADVQGKYSDLLGGIGLFFGFGASVALIVEPNFKLPKWPFTKERWFPKPTEVKDEERKETEEVTEEDLIEADLAEVAGAAGALKRRNLEFEWMTHHPVISQRQNGQGSFFKPYGKLTAEIAVEELEDEVEKVKNKTAKLRIKLETRWRFWETKYPRSWRTSKGLLGMSGTT